MELFTPDCVHLNVTMDCNHRSKNLESKSNESVLASPPENSFRSSSGGQKQSERDREREREKSVSTCGTSSAPQHAHSQPDSHKEQHSAIQTVQDMTGKPPQKPVAHVHPVVDAVVPVQPVADALDEDTICRNSATIVDELAQNKDFKVRVWTMQWTMVDHRRCPPHVLHCCGCYGCCGCRGCYGCLWCGKHRREGLVLLSCTWL